MNLEVLNLEEISYQESKKIDGGVVPPVIVVTAAVGTGLGVIIVGAVVAMEFIC